MLLFFCVRQDELDQVGLDAIYRRVNGGVRLWASLKAARKGCEERVVVLDTERLEASLEEVQNGQTQADTIHLEACLNLNPYLPPRPVIAGGGYVVRAGSSEPMVLLIYRRGVWDLPKGKLDKGESIEVCALREVREEIGIGHLRLVQPLDTTVHGYPEKGKYRVKTTYWYLMETDEQHFTPQAEEDIEKVEWVPWSEAKQRIGYATLRKHMEQVEPHVRQFLNRKN